MSQSGNLRNPHLEGSSFYWGAGPTGVLLSHGFTATTAEVRLLAEALFARGYTVAAPLLPGHGTTPQDCNRHTWEEWYASCEKAYFELIAQCKNVIVGGESTGALLALYLASHHPEAKAVLCYAPALRIKMRREKIAVLSLLAPFITSIPKAPSTDNNPWQGYKVYPVKGGAQLLRLQRAVFPILADVSQPIFIVQGKLDPTVHPDSPTVIYNRVSSTIKEQHWLENSTHCVILDKEHELAFSLTLDFLKRVLG